MHISGGTGVGPHVLSVMQQLMAIIALPGEMVGLGIMKKMGLGMEQLSRFLIGSGPMRWLGQADDCTPALS